MTETAGVILVLLSAMLWGFFPLVVKTGVSSMPPITFAAMSAISAAVGFFLYALLTGKVREVRHRKLYVPVVMVAFFVVIIPFVLYCIGATKTSGINTAMLLLAEIPFTLLITPLFGEHTTRIKIVGGLGIFFGALFILYNGHWSLNWGDMLIIASTALYPFGNFFSKRALNYGSPQTVLWLRYTLGGVVLLLIAKILEPMVNVVELFSAHWQLLLFNGLIVLGVHNLLFFIGFKRLDISKAIALVMTAPLFSLLYLMVQGERFTGYQIIGSVVMLVGV